VLGNGRISCDRHQSQSYGCHCVCIIYSHSLSSLITIPESSAVLQYDTQKDSRAIGRRRQRTDSWQIKVQRARDVTSAHKDDRHTHSQTSTTWWLTREGRCRHPASLDHSHTPSLKSESLLFLRKLSLSQQSDSSQ